MQDKFIKLDNDKFEKAEFAQYKFKNDVEQDVLKESIELHENHYAMVENYVEKYIPLVVQTYISNTFRYLFNVNDKMIDKLEEY